MVIESAQQNQNTESQQQSQRRKKSTFDRVQGAVDKGRRIYGTAQKAKTAIQAVRTAAVATNPYVWVVVAVLLVIIILFIIVLNFYSGGAALEETSFFGESSPPTSEGPGSAVPAIPGFEVLLTGPPESGNGELLEYRVTITYDPDIATVPLANIEIFSALPAGVEFESTSGNPVDESANTIVWPLSDETNRNGFTITLRPNITDTIVIYTVNARAVGGTSSGGSSPQEFRNLVAGQGRNTSTLGNRSSFVSTIISRSSGLPLAGKEDYLGKLYDAGIQYNVNPLILVVIWGVESSFSTTFTYPLGCLGPGEEGFEENRTCAAGSLDKLMKEFENNNVGGSLQINSSIGNTCVYTDAFDFAYEKYTPVCAVNDSNDAARSNFISFFKKFSGL